MILNNETLGWVGTVLSLAFYLALSFKRVKIAYVALVISTFVWGYVGLETGLRSLTFKEVAILIITLWGWKNWSKSQ